MKGLCGYLTVLAFALLTTGFLVPLHAVQAPAEPVPAEQTAMMFEGELREVDAETTTIRVAGAENQELRFLYNNQTQIVGTEGGLQGLAATAGQRVRVTYRAANGANQALRIEVLPRGEGNQ